MRTLNKARSIATRATLLVGSALSLAACSADITSPHASTMAPHDADKALVGALSQTYTYTVNPSSSALLKFGESSLFIPAGAICNLSSAYGPAYWNSWCTAATTSLIITATISGANTNHPRVDFSPALRFSPSKNVQLVLTVDNAATVSYMSVLWYCNSVNVCVDESLNDASLATTITTDPDGWQLSRRIKHFSGYVVAE